MSIFQFQNHFFKGFIQVQDWVLHDNVILSLSYSVDDKAFKLEDKKCSKKYNF